jgi:hypothetical protein
MYGLIWKLENNSPVRKVRKENDSVSLSEFNPTLNLTPSYDDNWEQHFNSIDEQTSHVLQKNT